MAQRGRPFKWVMCGVCGETIYGGPSKFGIVRFCDGEMPGITGDDSETEQADITKIRCHATAVVPTKKGAVVRWDKALYESHGQGVKEPLVEWADEGTKLPDMSRVPVDEMTIDDAVEGALESFFPEGYST